MNSNPNSHIALSRKSVEAQTLRVLRINANGPNGSPRQVDNRAPFKVRGNNPAPAPRERQASEATPQTVPIWERNPGTYYTGVGEQHRYNGRPGAHDHAKYKSLGT